MFGMVQRAAVYFGESAKRMAYMDAALTATSTGDRPAHLRLKKHCQTRLIEQADALRVFQELYGAVLEALGTMATDCDSNTSSAALQLTTLTTGFPFLIALTTAATLLEYTKPLSVILQRSGLDMCTAMGEVRAVQHVLADIRQNVDERFAAAYRSAAELGSKSGTEPTIPRLCGRQTQRTNIPAADPETYYRLGIYIPFLDHLMEGLSDRFGAAQQEMAVACKLVPSVMTTSPRMTADEQLQIVAKYPDMPSPHSFVSEYDRWVYKWKNSAAEASCVRGFADAYVAADRDLFPNIHTTLKVAATRPSSTAGNERSFSSLKRLKTYLRTSMSADRLTGLALLHIHRDMPLDVSDVIDRFARLGPHRLAFL